MGHQYLAPIYLFLKWGLTMLSRLALNSWAQVFLLP
jgi:hypothetical protein